MVGGTAQAVRVLLVEDNDSDAMIARAAIEKAIRGTCEVVRAATLEAGLAVLASSPVDLVTLDLNLPDSRGIDTLKRVRAAADCPIVVITVSDRPGLDAEALEHGAFEILHKSKLGSDAIVRLLRLAEERRRAQVSLDRTSSRLELALAASRACTWDYEIASREIVLSQSWAEMIGARPGATRTTFDALLGLVHPDDLPPLRAALVDVVKGRRNEYAVEHRVRHASGDWRWIGSRGKVVQRDARGRALRMVGSNIDITERKTAEAQVRESEARFRVLSELSSDWFWEQDEQFRFVAVSDSAQAHVVEAASHLGRTRWELPVAGLSEEQWAQHRAALEAHLPFRDFEFQLVTRHGEKVWVSVSGTPIFDEQGRFSGYRGVGSNVTARKRSEEQLLRLAQFDAVTGLANRGLLLDRLAQAIAQARRHGRGAGVLFIDLDNFKLVNDSYGHSVGDQLLAQVAVRLKDCVRPDDTVGRLGGDEFAVVIADLKGAEDAGLVARKIIAAFAAAFALEGAEAFVTVSVGVAAFPHDGEDAATLLKCADTAMYRAKQTSRNAFCFFSTDMNQRAASMLQLHNDLRRAVDRGEFRLHYQPKVRLSSGALVGMEALLRWQHPERGLVSPLEFIPALEDTGLILPVGDWVIEEARSQITRWVGAGLEPVPIAINLSARQFRRHNLDQVICSLLAEQSIPVNLLELEITESSLMEDPQDAVRQLQALREAGLTISVDDFGTGYSSLSYLTRLPLSTLKIDRSFVNAAIIEPSSAAIVRMVIDMARNLGFNVVAEGIETDRHVQFLTRQGCEQGQGYHFGKPAPSEVIAQRLKRRE